MDERQHQYGVIFSNGEYSNDDIRSLRHGIRTWEFILSDSNRKLQNKIFSTKNTFEMAKFAAIKRARDAGYTDVFIIKSAS